MRPFENYKIERVGDARLEERIRQAYARRVALEEYIRELTSEGEGGVGKAYEELYDADEDFYMLLELRERRGTEGDKTADLREKIKKHILAIREDVKKTGLDTSYISIAYFDNEEDDVRAYCINSVEAEPEKRFQIFYDLTEEER